MHFFSILVDKSQDVSIKEHIAVIFHYVDKNMCVIECFIGIEHVANITAMSLKKAIDALFYKHGLSMASLHGQSYNGASNISGDFDRNCPEFHLGIQIGPVGPTLKVFSPKI